MGRAVASDGDFRQGAPAAASDSRNRGIGGPVWTVGSLLLAVGDALAARFGAVAVQGELSGYTRASSGHCYFTLKDANGATAGIRCAMFRRSAGMLDFNPQDGQQVELRGRLAVYEARGELQMVVESMRRVGAGALYEEFLRLKARLEAAGLFAAERKRVLPGHPSRLGIVTSLAGAALHDVLTTLHRRAAHVEVIVYPTLVQGTEAPAAVAAALALANRRAEVQVLLLCRGGGSLEDLWAFNDERVVRAVADSALPVVCGVGHETDVTLADLAADLRAPTPTAAAELASPARDDLLSALQTRQQRMARRVHQRLDNHAQRLDQFALRLQQPARLLGVQTHRLQHLAQRQVQAVRHALRQAQVRTDQLAGRLLRALPAQWSRQHQALEARAARLQALDPRLVLTRGYAWVQTQDGKPVTSAGALVAGQAVSAVWADGQAEALITSVQPVLPTGLPAALPVKKKRRAVAPKRSAGGIAASPPDESAA
ncbi:exodeoxyribonuclease VII large subunit [Ideonella azotifigens]|uniref:Exodeoxyribonuclease 7 large subunit n=1 Tax=Ideonella azotifigens TaxID=513160 RepID=A0ABN1K8W1_9BURK